MDSLTELNKISPSFCVAKWHQLTLHLELGAAHACHHAEAYKLIPLEPPTAWHNGEERLELRAAMLRGERVKECEYCWRAERKGLLSDRVLKSITVWAQNEVEKILTSGNSKNFTPKEIEVSFGSLCNFKCVYCSPRVSSSIREEETKFGPLYLIPGAGKDFLPEASPAKEQFIAKFWDWFPQIKDELKSIRITGGEPLLQKELYQLLDLILSQKNPQLSVAINSNLGVPEKYWQKFLDYLDKMAAANLSMDLHASIDTWGASAEYLRHGLNLKMFSDRIQQLSQKQNLNINFMTTVSRLSIYETGKLWRWQESFINPRPKTNFTFLREPNFLSCDYLLGPEREKLMELCQAIEKFNFSKVEKQQFIDGAKTALGYEDQDKNREMLQNMAYFLSEIDKRRSIRAESVFPELSAILKFYSR